MVGAVVLWRRVARRRAAAVIVALWWRLWLGLLLVLHLHLRAVLR